MNKLNLTVEKIKEVFSQKRYAFFDGVVPYNLNIFGIRGKNTDPLRFDDLICVLYRDPDLNWFLETFKATTDPGRFWLVRPMNVNGTAILKEDQYRGSFKLGKHKNEYTALVQYKPVSVYRDRNRDEKFDLDESTIESGMFGINIHRASRIRGSLYVDKWSAGCQVFSQPDEFERFINLCEISSKAFGDIFTYTLLNERDFNG